jgi:hypothetical protein
MEPFPEREQDSGCVGVELKAELFQTSGTQLALTEHAQGAQEYKGLGRRLAFFRTTKRPDLVDNNRGAFTIGPRTSPHG